MTTIQPTPDSSTTLQPPDKQQYVDSIRGGGGDGSTGSTGTTATTLGLTEDSLLLFSPTTAIAATIQETTTTNDTKTRQRRTSMVTFANDVVNTVSDVPVIPPQPIKDHSNDVPTVKSSHSRMVIQLPAEETQLDPIIPVSESISPSSTSSNTTMTKFQSKQLRGNLTRKQSNRSPYTYYEVINVLGMGSMGSVAMVKKRPAAIGGSARKRNTTRTNHNHHPHPHPHSNSIRGCTSDDVTVPPPPPPCFQLPLLSPILRWFHNSFHHRDGIRRADSEHDVNANNDTCDDSYDTEYTPTIKIASSFASLHNNDSNTHSSKDSYDMTYAMKSIHISRCTDPTFVEELQNEIQILKTLDHPHIEKVMETFEYESQIFVVLELCYGGDLYQRDPYTEDEAARITSSILSAISYMHSKNILHRDLKYENILFVDESPTAEIKLIDFGLSKKLYSKDQNECTDGVGTIYTMAPEVLKGRYTKQADLWSIGVIAYMLMSSQMPFYGRSRPDIVAQIMEGKYEYKGRRWKRISKAGKAFVDDLLVVDPDDRATDDEALKASWLNRRYSATVRNPIMEEINLAKDSVLRYSKYSKIRRMALMVIAHKSTSAEIGILRKIFQQYDTEGKGHLNYEQFKGAIADSSLEEDDYRRIFDAVDMDGSEKIRYTEFLAATIEASGTISEVKLAEAFDRLDSDDSGYISVENLLEILGDSFTKEDVELIIKEVTVTNGQISYTEFLSLWESNEDDEDDDNTEGPLGNGFLINAVHEDPNAVIKTVYMNSSKIPFLDSERSTGAISTLSSDYEDTSPSKTNKTNDTSSMNLNHTSEEPSNVSRVNFLKGKMISERNMVMLDQAKKQTNATGQQQV